MTDTRTVYVRTGGSDTSKVYHIDRDCPRLQQAKGVASKPRSVIPHKRCCRLCSGEFEREGMTQQSRSHYNRLLELAEAQADG